MPRKSPDNVTEHRITLGAYEREKLNKMMEYEKNYRIGKTMTNAVGAIGWPILGIAAFFYAGATLSDLYEGAKNIFNKTTNTISDYFADNFVNYTSDEIGRAIVRVENEKAEIYGTMIAYYDGGGKPSDTVARGYQAQLRALEAREVVLRKMLQDIASGDNLDIAYYSNIRRADEQAELLQQAYEDYGGEGTIDWEINREDNRVFDDEGNFIGADEGAY